MTVHRNKPASNAEDRVTTLPTRAKGVAVVTGGSAGIGRATVRRFADGGWDVAIIAREQERLDEIPLQSPYCGSKPAGVGS